MTFWIQYGQYEFLVLLMELTNAPATFQRLMNQILHPKLDSIVMVHLDNILIYISGTKEEHKKEVGEVL